MTLTNQWPLAGSTNYLDETQAVIDEIDASLSALTASSIHSRYEIYNVLDKGAVGDGVTDDTVAIQSAIDTAGAAGGGTIYFPEGRYLLTLRPGFTMSSGKYALIIPYDNITFRGVGNRKSVLVRTDEHPNGHWTLFPSGAAKNAASYATADVLAHDFSIGWTNFTFYNLTGTTDKGDNTVTLATPADASNFVAGDFINIRTGQTLGLSGQKNPDSEMNQVYSVNAGTGVITLKYPLTKPYQQEYFSTSSMDTATTTTPSAWPSVYGVARVTNDVISNFSVQDMHFEMRAVSKGGSSISPQQVFHMEILRCTGDFLNANLQANGPWRYLRMEDCAFIGRLTLNLGDAFSGDKCCTDLVVRNCEISSVGPYHYRVHMNEGPANILVIGNRFTASGSTWTNEGFYTGQARAYNEHIVGNVFVGQNIGIHIQLNNHYGVLIDGNTFDCETRAFCAVNNCDNAVIGNNQSGDAFAYMQPSAIFGAVTVGSKLWTIQVNHDSATPLFIGTRPLYALIDEISIFAHVGFNGGAPTISVGTLASPTAWTNAVAVGTSGMKAVTLTSALWNDTLGNDELYAHFFDDGSTAGKAFVTIRWHHAPNI